jgi:hypothetical protein
MSTTNSNLPEWLQDNNKDVESNPTPASSGALEMESPETTTPAATNETHSSSTPTRSAGRCLRWTNIAVSLFFFVIFVASAIFKKGDGGGSAILWLLFYIMHAVTAGTCLLLQSCCRKPCVERPVMFLAVSMVVWSIIMVAMSGKQLADTPAGGPDAGGDNNNWSNRQEKAYELAGASLGLASGLYHVLIYKCCKKNDNKE